VDEDDGNYFFSRVGDDALVEDIASADAVAALEKYYADNKGTIPFVTKTADAKDGTCQFSGLSTGLYLVIQETPAPGFSALNAFLVSVPQLEDGVYVYEVTATIKSELEREPDPTDPPPTTPGPTLPQTGQLNWPVPVMAVSGMVLFLLGWFLYSKNGKKNYEK
jgi:LPXTG-motif cell wall-anchored protein